MKTVKTLILFASIILLFNSCVSMKKYNELEATHKNCTDENTSLKSKNLEYFTLITEQTANLDKLKKQNDQLVADSLKLGTQFRDLSRKFQALNDAYDTLVNKNNELMKGNKAETQKLIAELEKTKESLQKQEDDLKKMSDELDSKRKSLNELQASLAEKQVKLDELTSILNKKDSVVKALKNKVSDALLGYENKGLTVVQKNGKVYVSMEESLLFPSGKYDVTSKGADALKKLSKVLETNADINIMVEGNTDNVPYKGTDQLLDNWDLSAKRATSVIRILLNNSAINPERITAAGRSEYAPVDPANTPEARGKNRRTEIILSPKLDELLKIIDSN